MSSLRAVPRSKLEGDLSDLRTQIATAEAQISAIRSEMEARLAEPIKTVSGLKAKATEISNEIGRREANDAIVPTVSDHALIRYIERVHGIDIEHIRSSLLDKAALGIKTGAASVRVDDCTLVIKGSTVVTVMVDEKKAPVVRKMTRARRERMEEEDAA